MNLRSGNLKSELLIGFFRATQTEVVDSVVPENCGKESTVQGVEGGPGLDSGAVHLHEVDELCWFRVTVREEEKLDQGVAKKQHKQNQDNFEYTEVHILETQVKDFLYPTFILI